MAEYADSIEGVDLGRELDRDTIRRLQVQSVVDHARIAELESALRRLRDACAMGAPTQHLILDADLLLTKPGAG